MSIIKSAMAAISKSDSKSLSSCLDKMSKEELQELASKYLATSATIYMSGSWTEESKAELIDPDGKIIQSNISYERYFNGDLEQYYGSSSIHLAALIAIDQNVTIDYDSDYFTAGSMVFGEDYGLGADDATCSADSRHEERYIRFDELPDDIDIDECGLDDSSSDINLGSAFIQAITIDILLADKKIITLPLLEAGSNEQWFIFSLLFMSSKKSISDLKDYHYSIEDFMENNFGITL